MTSSQRDSSRAILIPIFNSHDQVLRCVASVLTHTPPEFAIWLLDDASTDPRLLDWLAAIEQDAPAIRVLRSDRNLGFVGNVNRGLLATRGDVIVLNSDTVVTAGWAERLCDCADRHPAAGIICPLSNNATILSVPRMNADNPLPDGLGIDGFAALVAASADADPVDPPLPVAVGFCMLIRRAVIDRLGLLHRAYHRGYGEECDYSLRAREAGFDIRCCDSAFVYHEGERSFGAVAGMAAVKQRNAAVLLTRWPFYNQMIARFCAINPLREVHERLHDALTRATGSSPDARPALLQVLHAYDTLGGTELHSRGVIAGVADDWRVTVLFPGRVDDDWRDLRVRQEAGGVRVLEYAKQRIGGGPVLFDAVASLTNPMVEATFGQVVAGGGHALVHVQHLLGWGTLALLRIAREAGAAVILSLHDYHLCCPIYDLLLPTGERCGRDVARAEDPGCLHCLTAYRAATSADAPVFDPAAYLTARRAAARDALLAADVIVAPSVHVRNRFIAAHGADLAERIRVIPHGVPRFRKLPAPAPGARPRVGIFANLNRRKGVDLLLETLDRLAGTVDLALYHFGGVDERYMPLLDARCVHRFGTYRLAELDRMVGDIDLALVPSIYEETFCLTIAELQSLGLPVLALAVGAIPERIRDGETGFLVSTATASALADRLRAIVADPAELTRVRGTLRRFPIKRLEDNQRDYARLYRQVLEQTRQRRQRPAAPVHAARTRADQLMHEVLALAEPDWRAGARGYGPAGYRRWLDHWRDALIPPDAPPRTAPRIDLALIERTRDPDGADLARTLEALRQCGRPGVRILAFSHWEPPAGGLPPDLAIAWRRIAPEVQFTRILNASLSHGPGDREGDWVGWVTSGDCPHPDSIDLARAYLAAHPRWRFLYTDEDRIAEDGRRYQPRFKPDINPELLRCTPYIGDLCLIERDTFRRIGGLDPAAPRPTADLCLRTLEDLGPAAIGHLPRVLYHRADSGIPEPLAMDPARSIARHLERGAIVGAVRATDVPEVCWVDYPVPPEARISLLILAHGDAGAVETLATQATRALGEIEILAIDFSHPADAGFGRLSRARRIRRLPGDPEGRLALTLNRAIRAARGEFILVCHDGIRLAPDSGLPFLIGLAARPDLGLAGPAILDPAGRIRQGCAIAGGGPLGALGQLHHGATRAEPGDLNRAVSAQNCLTVSDQAFVLRRSQFLAVGGFRHQTYPRVWYLLDYGLRLAERGGRAVWTPHARAILEDRGSFERYRRTSLRGPEVAGEVASLYDQWLPRLAADPTYNPNLSLREPGVPEISLAPRWDARVESRPRCAGLPHDRWGSGHYRVIDPLNALHRAGLARCVILPEPREAPPPNVVELARLDPDVLLLHNALHDRQLHAVELYRRYHRTRLIFALDDHLTDLPDWNPFARTNHPDLEARLHRQLAACDVLLVSTAPLAAAHGALAREARVVPNRLDGTRWLEHAAPRVPDRANRPRIGWAGAAQHAGDLDWLEPVLADLADEADWYFLGMCPDALRPHARAVLPMVDFARYPGALAALRLDIAIAPLALNDFNRCKSQLKLLEYGILGLPVICTDIEPYRDAPVERLPNDPARWRAALRARIHDRSAAAAEGERLRRWVRADWILEDHLESWLDALR